MARFFLTALVAIFATLTASADDRTDSEKPSNKKPSKKKPIENLNVRLLKDTVFQSGSSFSFNSLTIANTSSHPKEFAIDVEAPKEWQVLFDSNKLYTVQPYEVVQLPIRLAATKTTGDPNTPITVTLKNPSLGETDIQYIARVKEISGWRASLVNANLRLSRENKETLFQIAVSNYGNVNETLKLDFTTDLNLTVGRQLEIKLRPGRDTVLTIGIISDLRYLNQFKPQDIRIRITDAKKNFKLLLQRVYSYGTVFRENPSRWYNVPLALELVSQNVHGGVNSVFVNGNGNFDLSNGGNLAFNYRSDNFNSQLDGTQDYSNFDYTNKDLLISVGDQTTFNNFLLDGFGLKVRKMKELGYGFDVTAVNSRYGDARQMSVQQQYSLSKTESIRSHSFMNLDHLTGVNSYTTALQYDKYFGNNSHVILEAARGLQQKNINSITKTRAGSSASLKLDLNYPGLTFNTNTSLSQGEFPGSNKGLITSFNELRFVEKNKYVGLIMDYNHRILTSIDSAADYRFFAGRTREVGVRAGINLKRGYFNVTASVINQKRDSISKMHLISRKLNIYTSIPLGKTGNFTLSTNILKNIPSRGISSREFYTYNGFASVQARSVGAVVSYEQGPGIYFDPISFSSRNIDNSKYQFSPFIEKNLFNSVLNVRLQGDYQYNRNLGGSSISARGDISLDLKRHGMSVRVYGAKDIKTGLFKQDFLNLSIRKSFNVPLLGMKKYRSLKVVMFKDKNNNDVYDAEDEPVQKADFSINDQHFNTNTKGEAQYKNIPKGDYTIALGQVTGLTGWIAKNGYEQKIEIADDKALYIPFKESKFLAGKLNLVKDTYSNEGFNPGNIRVMAVNSKGETYNTLTNEKGEFSFNLPSDTYIVQINSNVFNDTFRVLQESFNADLLNNQKEEIVFEVRERKRQINIIRQSQTYSFSQVK